MRSLRMGINPESLYTNDDLLFLSLLHKKSESLYIFIAVWLPLGWPGLGRVLTRSLWASQGQPPPTQAKSPPGRPLVPETLRCSSVTPGSLTWWVWRMSWTSPVSCRLPGSDCTREAKSGRSVCHSNSRGPWLHSEATGWQKIIFTVSPEKWRSMLLMQILIFSVFFLEAKIIQSWGGGGVDLCV